MQKILQVVNCICLHNKKAKYSIYRIWILLKQVVCEAFNHVYWTWLFDVHCVDIMLNLHTGSDGFVVVCTFFSLAIYISFFVSLYNSISACSDTYSMGYILACWILWSWKCCMECYNKMIFFYKLQPKWFVPFLWLFNDE